MILRSVQDSGLVTAIFVNASMLTTKPGSRESSATRSYRSSASTGSTARTSCARRSRESTAGNRAGTRREYLLPAQLCVETIHGERAGTSERTLGQNGTGPASPLDDHGFQGLVATAAGSRISRSDRRTAPAARESQRRDDGCAGLETPRGDRLRLRRQHGRSPPQSPD